MSSFFSRVDNYFDNLINDFRVDFGLNRRDEEERAAEDEAITNSEVNEVPGQVRVLSVNFMAKFNAASHHCDKYELVTIREGTPVLRRSANFTIEVELSSSINLKKEHVMKLYFNFGPNPRVQKGTQAVLTVTGKVMMDKNHELWDVRVAGTEGKKLTLEVQIPSNAPVGAWKCAVEIYPRGSSRDPDLRHILRLKTTIYILFNPWSKHDATYMVEEERRQEYVLNDVGKIWQGGYPARGRHWVFGQFDDVVLPACVLLMERSNLRHEDRGDPILVSRAITKMVNSNDRDNGVIVGNWSGKYSDGTGPGRWTGSIKIMEEYMRTGRSVKYGQCWVFAGVTNTVCRALGMPARVVTNLNSAHDTDMSLTIDEYIDAKGNKITTPSGNYAIPGGLRDSIWNFHVWNDVWMTRPDLPVGYGGWQAIDSTPQEISDNSFQCGPASHEAIRRGQMEHQYDVPFVLAEVNADVVFWQEDDDAQDGYKKLNSNKNHVGRQLLTKRPGKLEDGGYAEGDREDCTALYKPPEGTMAERVTLQTAARRSRSARHAFRLPSLAEEDVNFSIVDIERINIGEDFTITVKAENTSEKVRSVDVVMKAGSTYYTGAPAQPIAEESGEFTLQPKESSSIALNVPYHKYYTKLVEHAMVKMVAHCRVKETSYAWVGDDCFEVTKPDLKVETPATVVEKKSFKARISFKNPLPETLRECVLVIDGPGLTRPKTVPYRDVKPHDEMTYEQSIVPRKAGSFVLVATFNCEELMNLTGSTHVTVTPQ